MPLAPQTGRYLVGLHKQSTEGTVGTVSDYTFPLLSGDRPQPQQDTGILAMTDGNAIQGDTFKQAGQRWFGDFHTAAWDDVLGTMLVGLWPSDVPTGAAPSRLHPFTGLGSVPPFMAAYADEFSAGSLSETFGKGICAGIEFDFSNDKRPLEVIYHMVGQAPGVATFTSTITKSLTDGFFAPLAPANTSFKFDEDTSTPAAHVNVQKGHISVMRPVTPVMTADGVTVSYLSLGLVACSAHLDLVWENWDAYKSTFYGSAAGTGPSSVLPAGSLDLSWGHSVSSTSIFQLKADKCVFLTNPPQPDPAASPLILSVDLAILKPASGDHVKPFLTNNVTAAY